MQERHGDSSSGTPGLLGDTSARDYSQKLRLFNAFAAPELRRSIALLELRPGMRVLDAGCGTGEALQWLYDLVKPGAAVGVDLSQAHLVAARRRLTADIELVQGDLTEALLPQIGFDLIWSVNTLNHLRDPLDGVVRLLRRLRPGGRIAMGQSGLLPEMFFAWDSRLERLVTEAVRRYYLDRYALEERDLAAVRSLVGLLQRAGLRNVSANTSIIERTQPLDPASEAYLREAIFRDTWGERLRPYLKPDDFAALSRLTDSQHPEFALRRPDFHFLQSFTMVIGHL